tara:strand:- start:3679 stop:4458 length:780 start_codon:yes stop_codon:yes gene_type:complete
MPTIYGADAQITGSLEVDGDVELGSGDDDVNIDSSTLFVDAANNRVGIGTITPAYKLHVNATAADTTGQITSYFRSADTDYSRICIDSTATADTQVSFMNLGATKWSVGNEATGDSFHISTGYGPFDSDNPLVITSTGDVTFSGNTSLDGGYIMGNESLTSADNGGSVSSTIPLSTVTNMTGLLRVALADGSTDGQVKKILCTGYNSSYSLIIVFSSASWAMGSTGSITISASAVFVDLIWVNSAWWVVGSSPAGVTYA